MIRLRSASGMFAQAAFPPVAAIRLRSSAVSFFMRALPKATAAAFFFFLSMNWRGAARLAREKQSTRHVINAQSEMRVDNRYRQALVFSHLKSAQGKGAQRDGAA